jgi:hypothetical protein
MYFPFSIDLGIYKVNNYKWKMINGKWKIRRNYGFIPSYA